MTLLTFATEHAVLSFTPYCDKVNLTWRAGQRVGERTRRQAAYRTLACAGAGVRA